LTASLGSDGCDSVAPVVFLEHDGDGGDTVVVDNAAVAAVFAEMGDLLSIVGGDPYRARAFKNTAQVIEALRQPLPDMLRRGQLKGVRGLGEGSVERIHSILRTGTCAEHQRLLQRLPLGLRELLTLRGLGPRHVRLAYEHLGVKDLAQLELAARSGQLARVPGIGPLTVERVLRDLERRAEAPPRRLLLRDALAVGDALVAWMLDDPHTIRAEQTGSARRRKETVGDLDVLVASTAPLSSSARFVRFPDVREVLMSGDARASVILEPHGVQADLRLVPVENWGAGLHYFTGSKAHNVAMRVRANSAKLTLSELGVWERRLRGGGEENRRVAKQLTPGKDEADIFAALGVAFIPPELREGEGEIDAAVAGRLPRLVDDNDLLGEPGLRARTRADATAIGHALARTGRRWAFWVRSALDVADEESQRRFRRDAARVAQDTGLVVWPAVEVGLGRDGHVAGDVDPGALREGGFIVVADATPLPGLSRDDATLRLLTAIGTGQLHGLTRVQGRALPDDGAGADIDLRTVFLACARHRVFVEVSGEPERPDLEAKACRTAGETGALLALSARPTSVDDVDRLCFALWQARRGWTTATSTLNALSVEHLCTCTATMPVGADDASTDASTDASDGDDAGATDDPLFAPARRAELRTRLAAFLQGHDDDELRRALAQKGGHPLQAAFALLAATDEDQTP
jgi:DNA polymerase (family 10)